MSLENIALCISCGLPGSGKTTYWKKFHESFDLKTALLIFEYDKIIPQFWLSAKNGTCAPNTEQEQSEEKVSVQVLSLQMHC